MKQLVLSRVVAVALSGGLAIAAASAFATNVCDRPNSALEQRACAKAAEGPDALRRFILRTRMIHALYYYDYASGSNAARAMPMASAARARKD